MAITVRSASQIVSATGDNAATSFTVPAPAGVSAGDLLVAFVMNPSGNYSAMTAAEFTQTGADAPTTNANPCRVWLRTAGGSEPANYTFGKATTTRGFGQIVALIGADTASPVDAALAWATGTSATSQDAPSVSPANTGSMLVCGWQCGRLGSPTYTVPGSMTEQADQNGGTNTVQALATELRAPSGATGARTATPTNTALLGWNAFSIAIKQAPLSTGTARFLPFFT